MGGITTGIGIFSGIDSGSLIEQLLAIESRPKLLAQNRITQLKFQQSAYLDINSRLKALQSAASAFRTQKTFQTHQAASSNEEALGATASTSAAPGEYKFLIDRLVTSQQMLSKGFADRDTTPIGATNFSFESAEARLDRDTALADLNDGEGVKRGKITITDSAGNSATVDLSKAARVSDVLDAINDATGIGVTASVSDGSFRLTDTAGGGGTLSVANVSGYTTVESLGLNGTPSNNLVGSTVYALHDGTAVSHLNDGNGLFIGNQISATAWDFSVTIGTYSFNVNLGDVYDSALKKTDNAVTNIEGVLERIRDAIPTDIAADVTVSVKADGRGLQIVDSQNRTITIAENNATIGSTASDLGFDTTQASVGTATGANIFAGLNTTLARNLNGSTGLGDGYLEFDLHDGTSFALTLNLTGDVTSIISQIETASAGKVSVSLSENGTGFSVTDKTTGGSLFSISGTGGDPDTAVALGIQNTAGTTESVINGLNAQHAYLTLATTLSSLNGGNGIGTGKFTVTDAVGKVFSVDIGSDSKTLGDLIKEFNASAQAAGSDTRARINTQGDGIEVVDTAGTGSLKIRVEDTTGGVAKALNFAGESSGTGANNFIDGSFERTVEFETDDTLDDVIEKINAAGVGLIATIINDGTGSSPFHISLVARDSGLEGRTIIDTKGFELDLQTLDDGNDSLVFFGSTDPAKGLLLTSSSNSLDGVVQGVTLDLKQTSEDPVVVTVTEDVGAMVGKINSFLEAYNEVLTRVDFQSRYDAESEQKGPLLGDGTLLGLRQELQSIVLGKPIGVSGQFDSLLDIGVKVGDGGSLTLDEEKFRKALDTDPAAVEELFVAYDFSLNTTQQVSTGITANDPNAKPTFTKLGIAGKLEELAKRYIDSVSGVLTTRVETLDTQVSSQERRITQFDTILDRRRQVLEAQFAAMERALAQLSTQQSALSQLQGLG